MIPNRVSHDVCNLYYSEFKDKTITCGYCKYLPAAHAPDPKSNLDCFSITIHPPPILYNGSRKQIASFIVKTCFLIDVFQAIQLYKVKRFGFESDYTFSMFTDPDCTRPFYYTEEHLQYDAQISSKYRWLVYSTYTQDRVILYPNIYLKMEFRPKGECLIM